MDDRRSFSIGKLSHANDAMIIVWHNTSVKRYVIAEGCRG